MQLPPENYMIRKYWTKESLTLSKYKIAPFPITTIEHKEYTTWAREFVENYSPEEDGLSDTAEEDPEFTFYSPKNIALNDVPF
jgi:hypothetical protein